MDKARKKNIKRVVALVCAVIVVGVLAAMPLIAKQEAASDGPQASILSGTVIAGSIQNALISGGTLAEEDAVEVSVPVEVKLKKLLVSNGDTVTEGTPIATVDRVTVMLAISQVQETLEYLSEQIKDAGSTKSTENVTALAGGTVKILYAEAGESVQNVMLEHGALAVLSLDGLMAVDLETESNLPTGTAVKVTLSDGTVTSGKVVKNLAGNMTITVEDDGYTAGDEVQVSAEDGTEIGSGALYIYSPWNATAYTGTVDSVKVRVGDTLNAGKTLMVLRDVGYSASYRQLISQRQEYEELMMDLFQMYQTETLLSPSDGVVSGLDKDGAYMLSNEGDGLMVRLLSFFGQEQTGFSAYAAKVTAVTEDGMTLQMASQGSFVADLTQLSKIPVDVASMNHTWNYSGDTTIHTQNNQGLLEKAGHAAVGDVLLIVCDEAEVYWFVAAEENDAVQTVMAHAGENAYVAQLSEVEPDDENPGENIPDEDIPGGDNTETEPPEPAEPSEPTQPAEPPEPTQPTEPAETYLGYVAQVVEVGEGTMKVKQTAYAYTITDLNKLPTVTVKAEELTQEVTYTGDQISQQTVAVNDYLLIITQQDGTLKHFVKQESATPGMPGGTGGSGMPNFGGMGGWGGMGGMTQQEVFEPYSLEMTQVAAVTPQNTITLDITVDELDVNALQLGMQAQVKINALGGEKYTATITEIGNTGADNGGSSKFTVELTMERAGNMLSGMNATATIVLSTAENVLMIPADALVEQGNETIVYTGYDEENEMLINPVTVKTGCSDGEHVEILEGLTAGQTYYYAYYDTLEISFTPDFGNGFMFH